MRTEPTNVTAPQWTAALWGSLESLIEEMADCCIKVYTLEKVLRIKRDPVTDIVFLDEAMKVGLLVFRLLLDWLDADEPGRCWRTNPARHSGRLLDALWIKTRGMPRRVCLRSYVFTVFLKG